MKKIDNLTINLYVSDMAKMAKYYTDVFDFHVTDDWEDHGLDPNNLPDGFWTSLLYIGSEDNVITHISLNQLSNPIDGSLSGRILFELEIDNIQSYLEKIKAKNGNIVKNIHTVTFNAGESRETVKQYKYETFVVEDPEGYRWSFKTKERLV